VGTKVIPEITDLNIGQSCRGYHPGIISHYKAPWANKDPESLPEPKWPGQVGDKYLSRQMLEEFYKPWIALVNQGVGVHCGECGCWNKTPHPVFLAWFGDVLDILSSNGIGFALWEFRGDFGILDSGRPMCSTKTGMATNLTVNCWTCSENNKQHKSKASFYKKPLCFRALFSLTGYLRC
jgi:endoglucanase